MTTLASADNKGLDTSKNVRKDTGVYIIALGYIFPLLLLASVTIPAEFVRPMSFFLGAVTSIGVAAVMVFLSSYDSLRNRHGSGLTCIRLFSFGLFMYFAVHWFILLLTGLTPVRIFLIEFVGGGSVLLWILVNNSKKSFLGVPVDYVVATISLPITAIAGLLNGLPKSLTGSPQFPLLFFFTTVPLLFFGLGAFRHKEPLMGVALTSICGLAGVDYLLNLFGLFDFTSLIHIQFLVLGGFTAIHVVVGMIFSKS